jgi:ribonuclease P protein component
VKRLLREAFRLHKHRLRPGLDLVLLARPEAASASYSQIAQAMLDVCERLNRWRG